MTEIMLTKPQFNLFDPAHLADPYPVYARMQEEAPVFWYEPGQFWYLTRYDDVQSVVKDPRRFSSRATVAALSRLLPPNKGDRTKVLTDILSRWLLFLDPPAHTQVRHVVAKAFSGRIVESLRETVRCFAKRLLDDAVARNEMNFVAEFAQVLPARLTAFMLGVPDADCEKFQAPVKALADFIGMAGDFDAAVDGVLMMRDYFDTLLAQRRKEKREDFISELISVEEQRAMGDEDIVATCVMLMSAGSETTSSLLASALMLLLQHPEQVGQMHESNALAGAIEECIRFEPPVHAIGRVATEDVVLGGCTIHAGQQVMVSFAAANRDPAKFVNPNEFIVTRTPNPHLSFSTGVHFCAGAMLARMVGQQAISTVLQWKPSLRLKTTQPVWDARNLTTRSLHALPLTW